jgi:heme oxygenase
MPLILDSVADALKSGTAALHIETEELLLPKFSGIRSYEDYASVLRMFYGFFHPLQQICASFLSADDLPDIDQRRHAGFILKDLAALGVQETPPLCDMLPVINSKAAAFGALYVMEGSTLGGRMISKMLKKHPAISLTDNHLHFFNGYGEDTGPMWTSFKDALNRQTEKEQILDSANLTFLGLKNWINHCLYAASNR